MPLFAFNEVDNIVISDMSYAHIENYISPDETVTVKEAAERYFSGENDPDYFLGIASLKEASAAPRFMDLKLHNIEASFE